jgi:hypothetical protein
VSLSEDSIGGRTCDRLSCRLLRRNSCVDVRPPYNSRLVAAPIWHFPGSRRRPQNVTTCGNATARFFAPAMMAHMSLCRRLAPSCPRDLQPYPKGMECLLRYPLAKLPSFPKLAPRHPRPRRGYVGWPCFLGGNRSIGMGVRAASLGESHKQYSRTRSRNVLTAQRMRSARTCVACE